MVDAAQDPSVRLALDVLDAVSKMTRRWSGSSLPRSDADSAAQHQKVGVPWVARCYGW